MTVNDVESFQVSSRFADRFELAAHGEDFKNTDSEVVTSRGDDCGEADSSSSSGLIFLMEV